MSFRDIKGQDVVVEYLKKVLEKESVPPTFIFSGMRGTGRLLTAKTFAKALNCLEEKLDSCDKCKNCIAINQNVHPNINIVGLKEDYLGIDEIRSISDFSFMPINSRYRVNIIEKADTGTQQAFNSMLKYFEEPPLRTVNILISENVGKIPETVRSRAVELKFKPLSFEAIKETLASKSINGETAELLAHISKGSLEMVEFYQTKDTLETRKSFIRAFLEFLKGENPVGSVLVQWKHFYRDSFERKSVNFLLEDIADIVHDILLVTSTKDTEHIINIDFLGYLADRFFTFPEQNLQKMFDILQEGKRSLLTNANPMHIMFNVLFRIREVVK
jgi:DNA polymerase-3 subunit delta'